MFTTLKKRKNLLVMGFATLILLGQLTVGVFAASNTAEQKHDMGAMTMTNDSPSSHDISSMKNDSQNSNGMSSMTNDSQNGNDMSSTKNDSQNGSDMNGMDYKKEAVSNDNPWPILYGFGGFISVVIIIAGIMKFTGMQGKEVN